MAERWLRPQSAEIGKGTWESPSAKEATVAPGTTTSRPHGPPDPEPDDETQTAPSTHPPLPSRR